MQNRFSRLAVPLLLGAACVAALAAIRTDYDQRADFSKYQTDSWLAAKAGNTI